LLLLAYVLASAAHAQEAPATSPALGIVSATPDTTTASNAPKLLIFDVTLNLQHKGLSLFVESDAALWVAIADVSRWRLLIPSGAIRRVFRGQPCVSLAQLGDAGAPLQYEIDAAAQSIKITAPASSFESSALSVSSPNRTISYSSTGGFLNYDLRLTNARSDGSRFAAYLEGGHFSPYGVFTSDVVWQPNTGDSEPKIVRRLSTFRHDRPETSQVFQFGDSVSSSLLWGRPIVFGGINWATNFDINPAYRTSYLPSVKGSATLPTAVEIYTGNVLRSRTDLNPGPFSVTDIPMPAGSGHVRVVVRDALGRETVTTLPFINRPQLVKSGLHDFAFALGKERVDFGLRSFAYGRNVAVGQDRFGLTDALTVEGRMEVAGRAAAVGAGATWQPLSAIPALFSGAAIASKQATGGGFGGVAQVDYYGSRFLASTRYEFYSDNFFQLGPVNASPPPKQRLSASASTRWGASTLGITGDYSQERDSRRRTAATLSADHSFPSDMVLTSSLTASAQRGEGLASYKNLVASVGISIPITDRTVIGLSGSQSQARQHELRVIAQLSAPQGPGWGWRVSASEGTLLGRRAEASAVWRAEPIEVLAEVASVRSEQAYRVSASGGFGYVGDRFFASRRIEDGVAFVTTPGMPNIPILVNSRPAGATDSSGALVIPRLGAYVRSIIRVDARILPLDIEIETDQVEVTPRWRSGVMASFALSKAVGVLIIVRLSDGTLPKPGSIVTAADSNETYVVGSSGRIFVTRARMKNALTLSREDQPPCVVSFDVPAERFEINFVAKDVLRVGPLMCKEAAP